jgi:hypothetical protein
MTEQPGRSYGVVTTRDRMLEDGQVEGLLEESSNVSPLMELGVTGLNRASGYVDEEFLPQLRGRKAVQVFKEMSDNDSTVGAVLFVIDRLLKNVEWRVEPAGKSKAEADMAKHLETCMDDMENSWGDFISEALSMMIYGWSWHEVVYKKREGLWSKDPRRRSKYNDGLIGWRKMPIRAQETLFRWAFTETGDIAAMVQMAPPRYQTVAIPYERSLLFRFKHHKGNPEGVSMLRNAYRSWYMKKRLEEFEVVGVERDLAGLPIVKVPAEYLKAKPGTEQANAVLAFKKMVKSIRRNEQEGIVFPIAYDQDTKQPLYSFELLGGGGARAFNTGQIIDRYDLAILNTVLADFIKVGHQSTGSYSLHTDKTGIFRTALNSVAQSIADTLNRHAIPRLFAMNGWRPEALPTIVPSDVDSPDIAQLAQFMSSLAGTGVTWFPDPTLENFVRDAARLPKLDEDEQEKRRQLQMTTEATAFATAQAEYLAAQQQAAMAAAPPAEQAAVEGEAMGTQEAAHAVASGQAEQQAAETEQQAGQAAAQQDQAAVDTELKAREIGIKEKQAAAAGRSGAKPKPKKKAAKR